MKMKPKLDPGLSYTDIRSPREVTIGPMFNFYPWWDYNSNSFCKVLATFVAVLLE